MLSDENLFHYDFLKNHPVIRNAWVDKYTDFYAQVVTKKGSIREKYYSQQYEDAIAGIGKQIEILITDLYNYEALIKKEYQNNFYTWNHQTQADHLKTLKKLDIYSPVIIEQLYDIKDQRNATAHTNLPTTEAKNRVTSVLKNAHDIFAYIYNIYIAPSGEREPYFSYELTQDSRDGSNKYFQSRTNSKVNRNYKLNKVKKRSKPSNSPQTNKSMPNSATYQSSNTTVPTLSPTESNSDPVGDKSSSLKNSSSYQNYISESGEHRSEIYENNNHSDNEKNENNTRNIVLKIMGLVAAFILLGKACSAIGSNNDSSSSSNEVETSESSSSSHSTKSSAISSSSSELFSSDDADSSSYLAGDIYRLSFTYETVASVDGKDYDGQKPTIGLIGDSTYYLVFSPDKKSKKAVITTDKVDVVNITKSGKNFDSYYKNLPQDKQIKYIYKDRGLTLENPNIPWKHKTTDFSDDDLSFTQSGNEKISKGFDQIFTKMYAADTYPSKEVNVNLGPEDLAGTEGKQYKIIYKLKIVLYSVDRDAL